MLFCSTGKRDTAYGDDYFGDDVYILIVHLCYLHHVDLRYLYYLYFSLHDVDLFYHF